MFVCMYSCMYVFITCESFKIVLFTKVKIENYEQAVLIQNDNIMVSWSIDKKDDDICQTNQ